MEQEAKSRPAQAAETDAQSEGERSASPSPCASGSAAQDHTSVDTPMEQVPRCIHLQGKAMAVHGEAFESDTDYQDGVSECWCIESGRSIGPDYGPVGLKACSNAERECYREF